MKFKYKASWIATVEKYPYESETKKSIVIGYDKHLNKCVGYNKETADVKFCDSFLEAQAFLVAKHEKSIKELEKALAFAKENLERANAVTESDVKDLRQ